MAIGLFVGDIVFGWGVETSSNLDSIGAVAVAGPLGIAGWAFL